jgi:xanthine dehydrogenase accessory factor
MQVTSLKALNEARRGRRPIVLVTDTQSGTERVIGADQFAADPLADVISDRIRTGRSGMLDDGHTFLTIHVPPPRLVVIGAVHISQALAPMARIAGLDMRVIDPRTAFATPDRFPDVALYAEWPQEVLQGEPLDAFTALAALTHDPKIDDLPLMAALEADCFYIGALGSRKTHAGRLERLREQGALAEDLANIHAPIGLDIGAQSPAEIAIAILAEVIAAMRRRPAEKRAAA